MPSIFLTSYRTHRCTPFIFDSSHMIPNFGDNNKKVRKNLDSFQILELYLNCRQNIAKIVKVRFVDWFGSRVSSVFWFFQRKDVAHARDRSSTRELTSGNVGSCYA